MARSNGEGSVYRSKDGAGWIAAVELSSTGTGKRVRRRRRARTKAEARQLLREMQTELATRGEIGDANRLVSKTLAAYLDLRASEGLSATTMETERWRVAIIERGIGSKRVRSLTVADCDLFLRAAADGDFSTSTRPGKGRIGTGQLRRVRSVLVRALRNDMRVGMLNRNVAELSVLPASKVPTRPRRALTVDELQRLLGTATRGIAVLIELSARYGLRPAESRAVRWTDLDTTTGQLKVGSRLNRANEPIGPKTSGAPRLLQLDNETMMFLTRWSDEQAGARHAAGPAWAETGLIATTGLGTAIDYGNVQRALVKLCGKVGISPPVSHYELRHTAISFQAEAGYSAWQIADWAGTSERMIADVYRHKLTDASPLGPAV